MVLIQGDGPNESNAPSASNYHGNESKYLADLQIYQDQLLQATGLVVKSGVYVPYSYYDEIIPYFYQLPLDTIDVFKLYDQMWSWSQTVIAGKAMDDYDELRGAGNIPRYLVVVVDGSSTADNINPGVAAFAGQVEDDELAENVVVFDEDIQGADWGTEDWLNEIKLMLEYAIDHY